MPTYLYCVRSDARAVPPDLTGLDGSPVRAIYATGLTAWVSNVADAKVGPTVERLKAHDAVCAAALDAGDTPLPVRFGQTFADDGAAASAIASRRPVLRERLGRVAGCVELRVVVSRGRDAQAQPSVGARAPVEQASEILGIPTDGTASTDQPPPEHGGGDPEGPGTAFLRRLALEGRADLAREVACEEVRHAVRTSAGPFIVDQQRCEAARGMSFFPLLVRRSELDACRAAINSSLPAGGIEASLLGPFPPYSFAGDA